MIALQRKLSEMKRVTDPQLRRKMLTDMRRLLAQAIQSLVRRFQVRKGPMPLANKQITAVAVLLGRESGALLVGERTNRAILRRIASVIRADPSVDKLGDLFTMQMGPEQVLLNVDIRIHRGLDVADLETSIDRLERKIRDKEPYRSAYFHRSRFPQGGVGHSPD